MQPPISSSVCVRLTPKCRDSVQLVMKNTLSKKQIRLINRNSNDFVSYEFDQIYGKQTTNDLLYENMIFNRETQSFLDIESGLYCFFGSQGVGKTYTVTGQLPNVLENSGFLTLFMQDFFQNTQYQTQNLNSLKRFSISPTTLIQLRFLQILGDSVQNIGFQTIYGESTNNQRQLANRIDYKIDIKNLVHYQNCITKIYQRKKPHMHLVVQVTLKNEPVMYTNKKTTMTFIQISSACFDQGNVHSQKIKTQVEALVTIFQNIPRIKHLQHLFEASKLTKLLRTNFFQAKKVNLIGILDNSFKGNSMTLKWLKTALQLKEDKTIIQSMKQDIKKQQEYLKSLTQKHKKAMTLLSKCIGTELSFLQKQKNFSSFSSKRQLQFGFGNSFNKRCQKIKLANLKKQENQEEIQNFNKFISTQQQEIQKLEDKYKDQLKKLQEERNEIISSKSKLITKMEQTNQQILYKSGFNTANGNSLYWRPQFQFDNGSHTGPEGRILNQKKNQPHDGRQIGTKKDLTSRNTSFKMSMKKIMGGASTQPVSATVSTNKLQRKKHDYQGNEQQNLLLQVRRQQNVIKQQTKRQIYELFKLISQQQTQLQQHLKQSSKYLSTKILNKLKTRQDKIFMNNQQTIKWLKQGKQYSIQTYLQFVQNQTNFNNFSKYLLFRQKKTQQTIVTSTGQN